MFGAQAQISKQQTTSKQTDTQPYLNWSPNTGVHMYVCVATLYLFFLQFSAMFIFSLLLHHVGGHLQSCCRSHCATPPPLPYHHCQRYACAHLTPCRAYANDTNVVPAGHCISNSWQAPASLQLLLAAVCCLLAACCFYSSCCSSLYSHVADVVRWRWHLHMLLDTHAVVAPAQRWHLAPIECYVLCVNACSLTAKMFIYVYVHLAVAILGFTTLLAWWQHGDHHIGAIWVDKVLHIHTYIHMRSCSCNAA